MKDFEVIKEMGLAVGTVILIKHVSSHPEYEGREGRILKITQLGHIQGTWGGLALIPSIDEFEVKK